MNPKSVQAACFISILSLCCVSLAAEPPADDGSFVHDFRVGVMYTNMLFEEDHGLSLVAEYNVFSVIWLGGLVGWEFYDFYPEPEWKPWIAGSMRLVFPGTDVADFQAFAAVGKAEGLSMRVEAGPIWKLKYIDVSLSVGFMDFDGGARGLRGFSTTVGVYAPGH